MQQTLVIVDMSHKERYSKIWQKNSIFPSVHGYGSCCILVISFLGSSVRGEKCQVFKLWLIFTLKISWQWRLGRIPFGYHILKNTVPISSSIGYESVNQTLTKQCCWPVFRKRSVWIRIRIIDPDPLFSSVAFKMPRRTEKSTFCCILDTYSRNIDISL